MDYHVHTDFSDDCNVPMETVIVKAIAKGLKEIAITDHVDYDYPNPSYLFEIDFQEYLKTFYTLKEKYNKDINIILGVEIGYQPHIENRINSLLNQIPFDFVIISTHAVDRLDLINGDYFRDKTQKNAYLRYFENVLYTAQNFNIYDVYGHLDFINRYGNYDNKILSYHDYTDIINTILKTIINANHGIELNTSGYRYNLNQTHPQLDILKRYKELGGEIITIGSDAHTPRDICSHFEQAFNLLRLAGFKRIAKFKQRKPYYINL